MQPTKKRDEGEKYRKAEERRRQERTGEHRTAPLV
jgi:hypothetical protein